MIGGPNSPYTVNNHPNMESDESYRERRITHMNGRMRLNAAGNAIRNKWKQLNPLGS